MNTLGVLKEIWHILAAVIFIIATFTAATIPVWVPALLLYWVFK